MTHAPRSTLDAPLTGPFTAVLKERRARYNALFADARRQRPSLEAEPFAAHLRAIVAPLVQRAAAYAPAAALPIADALYELSLDLVGQEFLGPRSRYPVLVEGWQHLLPVLAPRVAEAPRRFPGAITNALYQLASTPGARPREWMQALVILSPLCPDVETLLLAGQVAAWRCGLAHYRRSALEACARLDPAIAVAALGLPPATPPPAPADLHAALALLRTDPWLDPAAALSPSPPLHRLSLVRRVGAFRGFGGQFLAPPRVSLSDGHFVVSDGDSHWRLTADLFGAALHRTAEPKAAKIKRRQMHFTVKPDGIVIRGKANGYFPELAGHHSLAADDTTLAVTTPLSHAVFLVALVPVPPAP
jgi:hypothetical protein